jgi:mono/diheme cytochrome c family protein
MSRHSRALASLLAGALLISQFAPRALAHDRITTKVTWDREIAPIVQARCAGCHTAGGRSTIALTTYDEARPWAAAIKEEVLTRRMPKWNAARGFGDFANDPSLSPFEMALIVAWVDGGAPQRDTGRDATTVQPASASLPESGINRQPARVATLACKEQPLSGRLLAVTPRLQQGGTLRVAARLPSGVHEIIVWIRDYDPAYSPTYWLRRPLALPQGSRLLVESDGVCTIEARLAR